MGLLSGVFFSPANTKVSAGDKISAVQAEQARQRQAGVELELFRLQTRSAIMIQALGRGLVAQSFVARKRHGAGQLLAWKMLWIWRARLFVATRRRRAAAAEKLGRVCQTWLAVRQHAADIVCARAEAARLRRLEMSKAAGQIQAILRGRFARKRAEEVRAMRARAATLIQKLTRGKAHRMQRKIYYATRQHAATTLAAHFRGRAGRMLYERVLERRAGALLVVVVRLMIPRQLLAELRRAAAATKIARAWRSHRAWKNIEIMRRLPALHQAAAVIQSVFRGVRFRRQFLSQAAGDVSAIAEMLRGWGLKRHIPWCRRRHLSWELLREAVFHESQLGGVLRLEGRRDLVFWGIEATHERVRLVSEADRRRAAASKLRRQQQKEENVKNAWAGQRGVVWLQCLQNMEHPLCDAAAAGKLDMIAFYLRAEREGGPAARQTNLEQTDAAGRTPFLLACAHGHQAAAQALLEAGANADAADTAGTNAFILACRKGWHEQVRWLHSEVGVDPMRSARSGRSGFAHAVVNGDRRLVVYLVEVAGISEPEMTWVEDSWNKCSWKAGNPDGAVTPFFVACLHGRLKVASYLYKCGFECRQPAKLSGRSPREAAATAGHKGLVQWLDKTFAPTVTDGAAGGPAGATLGSRQARRARPATADGLPGGRRASQPLPRGLTQSLGSLDEIFAATGSAPDPGCQQPDMTWAAAGGGGFSGWSDGGGGGGGGGLSSAAVAWRRQFDSMLQQARQLAAVSGGHFDADSPQQILALRLLQQCETMADAFGWAAGFQEVRVAMAAVLAAQGQTDKAAAVWQAHQYQKVVDWKVPGSSVAGGAAADHSSVTARRTDSSGRQVTAAAAAAAGREGGEGGEGIVALLPAELPRKPASAGRRVLSEADLKPSNSNSLSSLGVDKSLIRPRYYRDAMRLPPARKLSAAGIDSEFSLMTGQVVPKREALRRRKSAGANIFAEDRRGDSHEDPTLSHHQRLKTLRMNQTHVF